MYESMHVLCKERGRLVFNQVDLKANLIPKMKIQVVECDIATSKLLTKQKSSILETPSLSIKWLQMGMYHSI